MMNVLITGGCGYLGKHISSFLSEKGYSIKIFDKNDPENKGDITNIEDIKNSLEGVDIIIHLAALPQPLCKENPKLANKINVEGTKNLVKAATNVKKIIYFSTFHVYGKFSGTITEETETNPLNEYGKTKLKAEKICLDTKKGVVLRFSNIYGAPLGDKGWDLVVNNFCKQAIDNKEIIVKGDYNQKRDFVGIEDMKQALLLVLEKDTKEKVFNVSGNNIISIRELAEIIAELSGAKTVYEQESSTKQEFVYSSERLGKLGYNPKSNIKEEIKNILVQIK
jgi:UDP-glucose 4-epimerase